MHSERPVEARGLVKRYGHITAVDHVDLTVDPGDVYGFLGPNGAGKTTTLRMLLGLIRPDEGEARLFGRDPQHELPEALDGVAGFVETPYFYPYLSGRKNLELLAAFDRDGGKARIDELLELVDLGRRAGDRVGGYSQGMRQRLGVASSLVRNPRLLLLDEPTNGLDPAGRDEMLELIRRTGTEFGIAVIVASHLLGEIERVCDHLVAIEGGQLLRSAPLGSFTQRTGTLAVEVEEGRDALATRLAAAGLTTAIDGTAVLIDLVDERPFDLVRDVVAELGLPLVRLEQRRHRLEDLFRDAPTAARPESTTVSGPPAADAP
jgi:ABC-2 type transport system ATP-binding protein